MENNKDLKTPSEDLEDDKNDDFNEPVESSTIGRVTKYLKNDPARWNIVMMIAVGIFLFAVNITSIILWGWNFWTIMSLVSALFGMANVTTYSIMNFPTTRLRRLRKTEALRNMLGEPLPGPEKFIWPAGSNRLRRRTN